MGTTLALIERNMKVMSAIQARLHAAMKDELKLLVTIIEDFGPTEYPYQPYGERDDITKDFDGRVDVIPVSNPNAATMSQRIMQYQSALQLSQQAPQLYDLPVLHRQMLEALGIRDPENIVPDKDDLEPKDPVTENMDLINGEPMKAFSYQDHQAHIQTHMSMMQDPKLLELLGQAPNQEALQAQMSAHIAEHLAFQYRQEIQRELGMELPPEDMELPPEGEAKLASLVAEAAAQLLQKDQMEVQQQQAAEQAADPILQLKQKELEITEQSAIAKAQNEAERTANEQRKIEADLRKAEMRDEIERRKLDSNEKLTGVKLGAKAMEDALDRMADDKELSEHQRARGVEIGARIADSLLRNTVDSERLSSEERKAGAQIGMKIAEQITNPNKPTR